MTSETRTFVNATDIASLKIECPQCRVQTIVALDSEQSRDRAKRLLTRFQCSYCHAEWFTMADAPYLQALGQLVDGLASMRERKDSHVAFEIIQANR
jgi:transposase-like protein